MKAIARISLFAACIPLFALTANAQDAAKVVSVKPKNTDIVTFVAPDKRTYKTTFGEAISSGGFKLEKLGVSEKTVGSDQHVSLNRTQDWARSHLPKVVGGTECSMEYLTLHIEQGSGETRRAKLNGTHGDCKKRTHSQGTVFACTGEPGRWHIAWAGEKLDKCPADKAPVLVEDGK